ncbi:MAG: thioredoxin [Ignavibacteria bacterium GWF2_33_9]|nr:MAG: thioredoxin [Ignavibacteria bacterium GWF2_33_9]
MYKSIISKLIFSFIIITLSVSFAKDTNPKITFVELGSVNCIPCKKMQPVMKAIEEKYGNQVKVIFYDVWKKEFKHKSEEYKIRLIPTQVFLDENGKEIHRHEGFYPEEDISKFLKSKGLKPLDTK